MKTKEVQIKYNGKTSRLFYSPYTDPQVVSILEDYHFSQYRSKNISRFRVFYGDTDRPDFERVHNRKPDPGKDWGEEYDVTGTIGESYGPVKIPLLIHNSRSFGGGAIMTDCIVRILINGREVYVHPNYHSDYDSARVEPSELASDGYTHAVVPYTGEYAGQEIARFRSERSAKNYLAFMKGERMSK